jgi:hypothetical protein
MSATEIPLLRESSAFAQRLQHVAARFGESRHRFYRRVNWTHRYDDKFYGAEAATFRRDPEAYLAGRATAPGNLADVFAGRLGARQVFAVLLKVVANRLFDLLGRMEDRRVVVDGLRIYRKGYVDDIELVFDRDEPGVLRAIHPFPLSVGRQWRYLRSLRRQGIRFKLAGTPYLATDVLRLVARRDVRSLLRMESRAQILQAQRVLALGMRTVQLSDEFDIGSLDFARRLRRASTRVINSAHGVGKYLPVHAYGEFLVLTRRQEAYYLASLPCTYRMRVLNDTAAFVAPSTDTGVVRLVFLSQVFAGVADIVALSEARVLRRLSDSFGQSAQVLLLYKAHPNQSSPVMPSGFARLVDLSEVNGRPGVVFVSFFSTCQIDPAFKGRKILLRQPLIHPEISFDGSEEILDLEQLVGVIGRLASVQTAPASAPARMPSREAARAK